MWPTTCRLRSIPLWPTPPTSTVSTSGWGGTDRKPGTIMSAVAVNASHRTPSGNGAAASRRNSGEPSRSAGTIAPNGSSAAHGEPPKGAPRVTTVSTSPVRRPLAMACLVSSCRSPGVPYFTDCGAAAHPRRRPKPACIAAIWPTGIECFRRAGAPADEPGGAAIRINR